MEDETKPDEAFRQFQKDVAALARMSGQEAEDCSDYEPSFRAQEAAREAPSESESESIESSPSNGYGAAVQRIPLEVRRLCGDDAAKEYEEWRRGVNWATNPLDVVTPHFVRRSDRVLRLANRLLSNAVHDNPAQANSGKTV